ncbi:IS66 family insertion sequence element accessory protein TnpA [Virgibacillus proomii]
MEPSNKRIEWETLIKDWKASGLSVVKWCREMV